MGELVSWNKVITGLFSGGILLILQIPFHIEQQTALIPNGMKI
jgi:hypothetical protein